MSAFEGKADMTLRRNPLSRSLLGGKRTWAVALQMSAYDQSGHRVGKGAREQRVRQDIRKTSVRGERVIHIGDNCFAIFAEVVLPYTFTYEN